MSDQIKYDVISRVLNKMDPKDISAELDMSYGKVLRIKREYEAAAANNSVAEFINLDNVVMERALAKVEEETPAELLPGVKATTAELRKAKSAAEKLSEDLYVTANHLNNRIRSLSMSIDHVSELEGLTSALCQLQTAFFNSNTTQVNVQNNYGDAGSTSATYGEFLSD